LKADRLLYHSTLGLRVIKKEEERATLGEIAEVGEVGHSLVGRWGRRGEGLADLMWEARWAASRPRV